MAKELKGSKTEQNLREAFAGESQARVKYEYYASRAKKDGYEQIAAFFDESSRNEKEHAKIWFKLLHDGMPDTQTNLIDGIAGESFEWTDMYLHFEKEARKEGFDEIANLFKMVGQIEKEHEARYQKLLDSIQNGTVYQKSEPITWICRNCGHQHTGTSAPDRCPVCDHPQSFFEKLQTNY